MHDERLNPLGRKIKELAEEAGATLEQVIARMVELGGSEEEIRRDIYWPHVPPTGGSVELDEPSVH